MSYNYPHSFLRQRLTSLCLQQISILVLSIWAVGLLCCNIMAEEKPGAVKAVNSFYPQFCFGFGASDPKYCTPAAQMKLLHTLDYDGYSQYGIDGLADVLKAVDDNRLKLFQFYVYVSLDPSKPRYDARLKEAIKLLKGRETIISLLIDGKQTSPAERERQTVEVVREIADMAAGCDLRVAIYPYYETVQDAINTVQKANRKNLGVIFSQVFFFITEDENNLKVTLKTAMPFLYAVNINGTDGGHKGYKGTDFSRLIQTLDRGSYDNLKLLTLLRELGYKGPIGLHCCYIRGDVCDSLARSMEAWKKFSARLESY